LPFGKGKPWLSQPGIARILFGGWQVNGILTLESGLPTDIRTSLFRLPINSMQRSMFPKRH
jgi:hypothetical protein